MTFWTLERIAQALGTGPSDEREIAGITTDTRSVRTGECFVALRGERFDGHDFLADAVRAGAGALVVDDASRAPVPGVPVFEVEDTLVALGALARFRREAWARPVIAVGGSNGKTSTKELLRAALGSRFRVRHIPVIDDGRLLGLVSIGDLVKARIADQQFTITQLEHYIAT
jgi:UDP-N-acetylmuramoyl-tripeptide--D-alanyl-D-alanine ligase